MVMVFYILKQTMQARSEVNLPTIKGKSEKGKHIKKGQRSVVKILVFVVVVKIRLYKSILSLLLC